MAEARIYDVYRADYVKGPFCSAIGGACASDIDFDNSFFQNPATLEAGLGNWDYDYDFNKSNTPEPGMSSDNLTSESSFMAGALYAGETWGYGFSVSVLNDQVHSNAVLIDEEGRSRNIIIDDRANTYLFSLPVGYKYSPHLAIGASLSVLFQHHEIDVENAAGSFSKPMSNLPTPTLSAGAIYKQNSKWRYGAWAKLPNVYGYGLEIDLNSFGNQVTYKEDIILYSPWTLNAGSSYMPFEDERTLFFDLDLIGSSKDSYLQSFDTLTAQLNESKLIKKGRSLVVEPRVGWRSAWGRGSHGTYMVGAYFENSRWEGESGRLHETFGISYKWTVNFFIFDTIELMTGIDVAPSYQQFLLTYR